jgi:hypothetical protein
MAKTGTVEYLHAWQLYNLGSPVTLATTVSLKQTTGTLMFGVLYPK